jgi:3-oxoacyl-[acyl-carrier-protein] synthase-1
VPASSTKGWTGHTLGAAGILEAVVALESMRRKLAPGTLNCENPDPAFEFPLLLQNRSMPLTNVMTNSFGFGGNNVTLIFGHTHD